MNNQWSDIRNLSSKLTGKRLLNASKIYASYQYASLYGTPIIKGLPISISIEPTTSCNLRCPECPSGLRSFTRPTGMLSEYIFHKVIDELSPTLIYLTLYFQGEPYLHPSFLNLVSYASSNNIYTATSTNAHYLDDKNARKTVESGLDRLIISIDGTTQEIYEKYRIGGNIEKVIEGTRNLVAWKKRLKSSTPHLIFQFLVLKHNEHQVEDLKKLGREMEVDEVAFKTAQIYDFEDGSDLIPTINKYSRYKQKNDGKWHLKNKFENRCWRMWHSSVVTWDGKILPCCFDKDGSHQVGDISSESFKDIWESTPYQNFRRSLFQSRTSIDICKNCTEGTKVWA